MENRPSARRTAAGVLDAERGVIDVANVDTPTNATLRRCASGRGVTNVVADGQRESSVVTVTC